MNELNEIKHKLPYREPDLGALRERIRCRTTLRSATERRQLPMRLLVATASAAAIALVVGLCAVSRGKTAPPTPSVEQLLTTASTETLQKAAAENYDDILNNQQL